MKRVGSQHGFQRDAALSLMLTGKTYLNHWNGLGISTTVRLRS
jgi:hypothetical protein